MEKVEASILGTIYRNDDNGYTVLTAREGRREITVVGTLPELHPGEQAVFTGEWVEHPSYGKQLKCTACQLQLPTTKLGIERVIQTDGRIDLVITGQGKAAAAVFTGCGDLLLNESGAFGTEYGHGVLLSCGVDNCNFIIAVDLQVFNP